jgi:hypothetical protein
MQTPRVTSEFWVSAYKKVLESHAIPIFVVQKGNMKAGAIIVRVSDLQGLSKIFLQSYDLDGNRRWIELAAGEDSEMDGVILRQKEVDCDLWVLEVETRNGHHYLDPVST